MGRRNILYDTQEVSVEVPKIEGKKMEIVKKAISKDGSHVMFMYKVVSSSVLLLYQYAIMFDNLPCVNPSNQAFVEMMWERHLKLYDMKEVEVTEKQLPHMEKSGMTKLFIAEGARFLKPVKREDE